MKMLREAPRVETVDEYLVAVKAWRHTHWQCAIPDPAPSDDLSYGLFRGQASRYWPLKSKIARLPDALQGRPRYQIEYQMLAAWKRKAARHRRNLDFEPEDDWEWLACAQHYGLDTRLLDWTAQPLYALFFACDDDHHIGEDGAVWGLRGSSLPVLDAPSVPMCDRSSLVLDPREGNEVWIYAPRRDFSNRLTHQQGYFTVQRRAAVDLRQALSTDRKRLDQCGLQSVVIPGPMKSAIVTELRERGVGLDRLFPDPGGVARHIRREYMIEPG